jgi:hypothetical protein
MCSYHIFSLPVIPRSAKSATWGPSFIRAKLNINLKKATKR